MSDILIRIDRTHTHTHHRDNCPGLKECDAALAQLNSVHKQIDQASQMAMQYTLQVSSYMQFSATYLAWYCILEQHHA